jgi:lysophospholipase L1-like esterase
MKQLFVSWLMLLLLPLCIRAQHYDFDFTKAQPIFGPDNDYGWDFVKIAPPPSGAVHTVLPCPTYFSVRVPDGNYKVTVTIGSKKADGNTVIRAESRRLLLEATSTRRGEFKTFSFVVNKRSPKITGDLSVTLKEREKKSLSWDDRLTLEFNGSAPTVKRLKIERDTTAITVFLCGNSTVVDQDNEPWCSWGQIVPRWFTDGVAISNHAASGLSATSFLSQHRLDKILSMMRPGDYVFCEFGHNDQKEKGPGTGAYYNFAFALKTFIDKVRAKDGNVVFVTPTQRRVFENRLIVETHGDYPAAMREVARRETVPVIDLHEMTRTFFEKLGPRESKRAMVYYPANTFPGQDKALEDNTHFNPYGAYEISKMVVWGMVQNHLFLERFLRPEARTFNPLVPDDWQNFKWFPAPIYDSTTIEQLGY